MRSTLCISTAALLLILALTTPERAEAEHGWSLGASFQLGGVYFNLGFQERSPDDFYWRTNVDLGRTYYGRAHRSSGCQVRDGYHYHGRQCPLIRDFFHRNGSNVDAVFDTYASSPYRNDSRHYDYDPYNGYRDDRQRDNRYREERYDRYRYRARNDDRAYRDSRYRRGSSCPYR